MFRIHYAERHYVVRYYTECRGDNFLLVNYKLPNLWVYWIDPLMALVDWRKSFATKWGKKGKQENKKRNLVQEKQKTVNETLNFVILVPEK